MLKHTFNFAANHAYVRYARMSSDKQNPRSPDQQFNAINDVIRRRGLAHWRHLEDYRDDAKSGRYMNRPDFTRMLADIMSGRCRATAILVHSADRLGRNDDILAIRTKLYRQYGVVVLTADGNFEDPLSCQGQVFAVVENMRSTGENQAKAEKVLMGKLDLVRQGYWGGGPAPLGYELAPATDASHYRGRGRSCPSLLKVNVQAGAVVKLMFDLAYRLGWGQDQIAAHLNSCPDVPADFKRKSFSGATVGRRLDSRIYIGTLEWNVRCTDVVNDQRVSQRNTEDEVVRIEGFCEPLVDVEVFEAVNRMRRERGAPMRAARAENDPFADRPHRPLAPGVALTYPLSGLIVCGDCRRAMTVNGSAFAAKDGSEHRYDAYVCPGGVSGACTNRVRVPEDWLRRTVFATLRQRLFPSPPPAASTGRRVETATIDAHAVTQCEWFSVLREEILREVQRLSASDGAPLAAIESEIAATRQRRSGWVMSLGNPSISPLVRESLESALADSAAELHVLENRLRERLELRHREQHVIDVADVVENLNRLDRVFESANASLLNVALAEHIDRVECGGNRSVVVRTCRLGSLEGVRELFAAGPEERAIEAASASQVVPRRRTARRVGAEAPEPVARRALDPERFASLPDQWFWSDAFVVPVKERSWARAHAEVVALRRIEGRLSYSKLAAEFGKCKPTIETAVQHYLEQHPEQRELLRVARRSQPKKRLDYAQHADQARRLWESVKSELSISKVIGCSAPTVQSVLKYAYGLTGETVPTRNDLRRRQASCIRTLRDQGRQLAEIAEEWEISVALVRKRLRESYAAEGVILPDQRRRETRRQACAAAG